jgi:hypothetical protein
METENERRSRKSQRLENDLTGEVLVKIIIIAAALANASLPLRQEETICDPAVSCKTHYFQLQGTLMRNESRAYRKPH